MSRRKHFPVDAKTSKIKVNETTKERRIKITNKGKEKRRTEKENLAYLKFGFLRMPQPTFVLTNFFNRENVILNKCLPLHDDTINSKKYQFFFFS